MDRTRAKRVRIPWVQIDASDDRTRAPEGLETNQAESDLNKRLRELGYRA